MQPSLDCVANLKIGLNNPIKPKRNLNAYLMVAGSLCFPFVVSLPYVVVMIFFGLAIYQGVQTELGFKKARKAYAQLRIKANEIKGPQFVVQDQPFEVKFHTIVNSSPHEILHHIEDAETRRCWTKESYQVETNLSFDATKTRYLIAENKKED